MEEEDFDLDCIDYATVITFNPLTNSSEVRRYQNERRATNCWVEEAQEFQQASTPTPSFLENGAEALSIPIFPFLGIVPSGPNPSHLYDYDQRIGLQLPNPDPEPEEDEDVNEGPRGRSRGSGSMEQGDDVEEGEIRESELLSPLSEDEPEHENERGRGKRRRSDSREHNQHNRHVGRQKKRRLSQNPRDDVEWRGRRGEGGGGGNRGGRGSQHRNNNNNNRNRHWGHSKAFSNFRKQSNHNNNNNNGNNNNNRGRANGRAGRWNRQRQNYGWEGQFCNAVAEDQQPEAGSVGYVMPVPAFSDMFERRPKQVPHPLEIGSPSPVGHLSGQQEVPVGEMEDSKQVPSDDEVEVLSVIEKGSKEAELIVIDSTSGSDGETDFDGEEAIEEKLKPKLAADFKAHRALLDGEATAADPLKQHFEDGGGMVGTVKKSDLKNNVIPDEDEEDLEVLQLKYQALQGLLKSSTNGSPEAASASEDAVGTSSTEKGCNMESDTDTILLQRSVNLEQESQRENRLVVQKEENELEDLELQCLRSKLLSDMAKAKRKAAAGAAAKLAAVEKSAIDSMSISISVDGSSRTVVSQEPNPSEPEPTAYVTVSQSPLAPDRIVRLVSVPSPSPSASSKISSPSKAAHSTAKKASNNVQKSVSTAVTTRVPPAVLKGAPTIASKAAPKTIQSPKPKASPTVTRRSAPSRVHKAQTTPAQTATPAGPKKAPNTVRKSAPPTAPKAAPAAALKTSVVTLPKAAPLAPRNTASPVPPKTAPLAPRNLASPAPPKTVSASATAASKPARPPPAVPVQSGGSFSSPQKVLFNSPKPSSAQNIRAKASAYAKIKSVSTPNKVINRAAGTSSNPHIKFQNNKAAESSTFRLRRNPPRQINPIVIALGADESTDEEDGKEEPETAAAGAHLTPDFHSSLDKFLKTVRESSSRNQQQVRSSSAHSSSSGGELSDAIKKNETKIKLAQAEREFLTVRKNATELLGNAITKIQKHAGKKEECAKTAAQIEKLKRQLQVAERSLLLKSMEAADLHQEAQVAITRAFVMRTKSVEAGTHCKNLSRELNDEQYQIPTAGAAEMLVKFKEVYRLTTSEDMKQGAVNFKRLQEQIEEGFEQSKFELPAPVFNVGTVARSSSPDVPRMHGTPGSLTRHTLDSDPLLSVNQSQVSSFLSPRRRPPMLAAYLRYRSPIKSARRKLLGLDQSNTLCKRVVRSKCNVQDCKFLHLSHPSKRSQ